MGGVIRGICVDRTELSAAREFALKEEGKTMGMGVEWVGWRNDSSG